MSEYCYVKSALAEFSEDLEYSFEEYASNFKTMIELSPDYAKALKAEIEAACADPNWSWAAAASDQNFIGQDDSDISVWESVKSLIWPVVASGEAAPVLSKFGELPRDKGD